MSIIGFPGYGIVYMKYLKSLFDMRADATLTHVANRVYLTPIEVPVRLTVDRICVSKLGVAAGNYRAGIYKDNGNTPTGGALVVESDSIAKGGAWASIELTIAATQLEPGLYWIAILSDEATTQVLATYNSEGVGLSVENRYYDIGAYGALTNPCPATLLAPNGNCPNSMLRVSSIYQPL